MKEVNVKGGGGGGGSYSTSTTRALISDSERTHTSIAQDRVCMLTTCAPLARCRWVMDTVDRVRGAVSASLVAGAPTVALASVDRLTGRSASVRTVTVPVMLGISIP